MSSKFMIFRFQDHRENHMKALSKMITMGMISFSIVACSTNKPDDLTNAESTSAQKSEGIFKVPTQPAAKSAQEALDGLESVEQKMTEAEKLEADRKERELALKEQKQAAEIAAAQEALAVEDRANQAQTRADFFAKALQYVYLGQQAKMMGDIMKEDSDEPTGILERDYAGLPNTDVRGVLETDYEEGLDAGCIEVNTAAGTSGSSLSEVMKIFREAEAAGIIPADPYAKPKAEEDSDKKDGASAQPAPSETDTTVAAEQTGGRMIIESLPTEVHAQTGDDKEQNSAFDFGSIVSKGKEQIGKFLRDYQERNSKSVAITADQS